MHRKETTGNSGWCMSVYSVHRLAVGAFEGKWRVIRDTNKIGDIYIKIRAK